MHLSVLLPTYRHDLAAVSRIAQVCSWASPDVEVIVRDNSGNAEKRALIASFARDNCRVISVDPCQPIENLSESLRLAKGDFVFCVADDDLMFDRAIAAMSDLLRDYGADRSVVGISGSYLVEASRGSALVSYPQIESEDVVARVTGYLSYPGVNVLFYSPLRRSVLERALRLLGSMPFSLSYHDQINCLLYLLNGKFIKLPNVIYGYDVGPWERIETAQQQDVKFLRAAGLDPALNKLHWFLCGFEGAVLIRNSDLFPDYPLAQRQRMADLWFSTMFQRFVENPRLTFGSPYTAQAEELCRTLRGAQGQLSFIDMLKEICLLMGTVSEESGRRYLTYWAEYLKPRSAAA